MPCNPVKAYRCFGKSSNFYQTTRPHIPEPQVRHRHTERKFMTSQLDFKAYLPKGRHEVQPHLPHIFLVWNLIKLGQNFILQQQYNSQWNIPAELCWRIMQETHAVRHWRAPVLAALIALSLQALIDSIERGLLPPVAAAVHFRSRRTDP
jgi:hypothetical protein